MGTSVKVLSPRAVRTRIATEAAGVVDLYCEVTPALIDVGERGGPVVDERCRTSAPSM